MPQIEIRPARPEDRNAILAFCAHTWEWGDYIEYVWDEWLHDPNGILLVALIDGKPVGIEHMRMLTATEAWLEGMRVDPAYRRQGVAAALNTEIIAEAMRRGAKVARLITESTNTNSIRLLERSYMRQVGAYAPYKAMPIPASAKRQYEQEMPTVATAADLNDIIDYLNVSNIFPAVGGLYYEGFTAYSITQEMLEAKIAAHNVYLLRRWDRLDGLAIAQPREGRQGKNLFIGYIDGTTESISLIAYALRDRISEMNLDAVQANVPDLIMVRDAFTGAEYEWDGTIFYTYERVLE
ncbi:MAG TPA: GNAT family N-acetyltransferase [Ktedonobacteraceae bacterium]|nr:GNAT family N-acetyltransferase [Ktedonobacteraceae bacterium]